MNTVKSQLPQQTPRVLSFFSIPDRGTLSRPPVASWVSSLSHGTTTAGQNEKPISRHPLFLRVVGAATGELKTEGTVIGLDKVSVVVGSEGVVLNSLRHLLVEEDCDIVMYHEHPVPVRILLFRLLLQKRLPLIIDQVAAVRRSYNLAAATSLQGSVPFPPLDVAVAAIGGGPEYVMPDAVELEGAVARGQWRDIEQHLVRSLDMTAYTYCRLAGVEPGQYRSITSTVA